VTIVTILSLDARRADREDVSDSRYPQHAPHTTSTAQYGHAAIISGICSLAATHEQLIIGWTGAGARF
jgi:hypothetical protein